MESAIVHLDDAIAAASLPGDDLGAAGAKQESVR
jgi:hypothetical protein